MKFRLNKIFVDKGQASLEYLMTYGWAILAVIVVGAAMWQLGFLSPRSEAKSSRGFPGFEIADFTIYGKNTTSACSVALYAINSRPNIVVVTDMTSEIADQNWSNGWCAMEFAASGLIELNMSGDNDTCMIAPGQSMIVATWEGPLECPPSEFRQIDMELNYRDLKTGLTHKSAGRVTSAVTEAPWPWPIPP